MKRSRSSSRPLSPPPWGPPIPVLLALLSGLWACDVYDADLLQRPRTLTIEGNGGPDGGTASNARMPASDPSSDPSVGGPGAGMDAPDVSVDDPGSGGSDGGADTASDGDPDNGAGPAPGPDAGGQQGSGDNQGTQTPDAGEADAGQTDAGQTDAGQTDAGTPDAAADGGADASTSCVEAVCCPPGSPKPTPGECGCDYPDTDQGDVPGCVPLRDALAHRYRFDGTGMMADDARGGAHGTVVNATLDGSGSLTLAGGDSDEHVDLPNGILSALTDATLEAFFVWRGSDSWERLFDFGVSTIEGIQGTGREYLMFTASNSREGGVPSAAYTIDGYTNETATIADAPLVTGSTVHVVVVFDDSGDTLSLYLDGALADSASLPADAHLSNISDVNNWLGRAQFSRDPGLTGVLHEFRIYNTALTAAQVALSHAAGPDPAFLE